MHREPTMECGGVIKGEAPQIGVVCPNTHKTEKQLPHNMQCAKTMQEHRSMGPLGGCVHPQGGVQTYGGHMNIWGHTNVQGVYKHGGVQPPPQV